MPPVKKPKASPTGETGTLGRPVLYPKVKVRQADDDNPLTSADAKDILGWEEEAGDVKFGDSALLTLPNGTKIRCLNNVTNRPLTMPNVEALEQDLLNRRWRFNGEPVIIGVTGLVLNGQHSLVALVLADLTREADPHWAEKWPTPVTMAKLVVYGVDESDAVVNTMDTCKPRTLTDVLYRSEYYADLRPAERKALSAITNHCVRRLWDRTHAGLDAYSHRRTHAETMDFLRRHPHIKDAVIHVSQENSEGRISRYLTPGTAAALVYLMGASGTDGDAYAAASEPSETLIDWTHWDRACTFMVVLASPSDEFHDLRQALGALNDPETGAGGGTEEKWGVLCKAWGLFREGEAVTEAALKGGRDTVLEYRTDEDGVRILLEYPALGGVDFGRSADKDREGEVTAVTEEDVAAARADADDEGGDDAESEAEPEEDTDQPPRKRRKKADASAEPAGGEMLGPDSPEGKAAAVRAVVAGIKAAVGGAVLAFKGKGGFVLWEEDATGVSTILGRAAGRQKATGLFQFAVKAEELKTVIGLLAGTGQALAVCSPTGDDGDPWAAEIQTADRPLTTEAHPPGVNGTNGTHPAPAGKVKVKPGGGTRPKPGGLRGGTGK